VILSKLLGSLSFILVLAAIAGADISSAELAKLTADKSGGSPGDDYGWCVAISGDTAVVGVPRDDDDGGDSGAVMIFVRSGTTWTLQAEITASDATAGDEFGTAVALYDDLLVIGAPYNDHTGLTDAGAVYVFERQSVHFDQRFKLTASDAASDDRYGSAVAIDVETLLVATSVAATASGAVYPYRRLAVLWTEHPKVTGDFASGDSFGSSVAISGSSALIGAATDPTGGADAGAAYVFVRSGTNWSREARFQGVDTVLGDAFGASIAIDGDTAVVGARQQVGCGGGATPGAAYVFTRSGTSWVQEQKLVKPDASACDDFGYSVDVEGDDVVVGSRLDDQSALDAGAAYVFVRNGTTWSFEAKVTGTDASTGDLFGNAVGFSADTLVVGATEDSHAGGAAVGSAYVLVRSGTTWSQQTKLSETDAEGLDELGSAAALEGDTAVLGAQRDSQGNVVDGGSVYVFKRDGAAWGEVQKLTASDAGQDHRFGGAVTLQQDTLLVGAFFDDDLGPDSGSAYVFTRSGATWTEDSKLLASDGGPGDLFGHALDMAGDTAVVGAMAHGLGGAAYVFQRSGTAWSEQQKLVSSDIDASDRFGNSISISTDTILVGAWGDNHAGTDSGSAYVFQRVGTVWGEQQKLTANDADQGDMFGDTVSVDGDTAVVGAWRDRGVNSDEGAAYVFVRAGTVWTQQQKLLPSDPFYRGYFGFTTLVEGDRILIGAPGKDDAAGAVYVFQRTGTTWTQQLKLVASDGLDNDNLSYSVALWEDTVLAGAYHDNTGIPLAGGTGSGYLFGLVDSASFCNALDGALDSCPCNNPGDPGSGCEIRHGTGGVRLDLVTQESGAPNRVTWSGTGFPTMGSPASIVIRSPLVQPVPLVFGDGLLCIGAPLVRLGATFASNGITTQIHGHGSMAGSGFFYYQLWFRNIPASFCTPGAFNLSNARALTW